LRCPVDPATTLSTPSPSRAGLGITLTVLATLCFALLDTASQYIGPSVPVLMVIWARFLVQTVTTLALLWPERGRSLWVARRPAWQLLRGVVMVFCSAGAYLSLQHVPVGEFTAIMMLVPLSVTLLAAMLLHERVGALNWLLVGGGFTGALIVVHPGDGDFTLWLLLPLGLVLLNAVYQIVTSHMVRTEDAGTTHFYTGLVGLALSSLLLPWTWSPPATPLLWALLVLLGVFGSVGHYLLIRAFHAAPASRLTPYMYAQIAFATLGGWIVFGHTPDAWTVAGIAIIALCGLLGVRLRRG
jgi:drug/metabolite transporter (DMT)-like permease